MQTYVYGRWLRGLLLLALMPLCTPALGQVDDSRFGIGLETGAVGFTKNDVRIPGDTGTRFDMTGLTGSGPEFFVRLDAHWDINDKHGLRVVLSPLEVSGTGELAADTEFAGGTFPAGTTDATYQFSAYKLTYRYTFFENASWQWRVGVTGVIRDANVELRQADNQANDDNVGFVPTLHLSGVHRFSDRWRFSMDFDGLAGGPGRLIDLGLKLDYTINKNWRIGGGYRTVEGGVETDDVYNFAWLNYAVLDVRYWF